MMSSLMALKIPNIIYFHCLYSFFVSAFFIDPFVFLFDYFTLCHVRCFPHLGSLTATQG